MSPAHVAPAMHDADELGAAERHAGEDDVARLLGRVAHLGRQCEGGDGGVPLARAAGRDGGGGEEVQAQQEGLCESERGGGEADARGEGDEEGEVQRAAAEDVGGARGLEERAELGGRQVGRGRKGEERHDGEGSRPEERSGAVQARQGRAGGRHITWAAPG
jgi:hypothetical protein